MEEEPEEGPLFDEALPGVTAPELFPEGEVPVDCGVEEPVDPPGPIPVPDDDAPGPTPDVPVCEAEEPEGDEVPGAAAFEVLHIPSAPKV